MPPPAISPDLILGSQAFGKPVCRLGLASRGGSGLRCDDVQFALEQGINFLNWPGEADLPGGPDAVSEAVASLGARRDTVVVSVQFGARTAKDAAAELRSVLKTLKSEYIDFLTFYYVESAGEWEALLGPSGALTYCANARRDGLIRRLGVTSHQRPLAAAMARSGLLDGLMLRYNAAHRGAEREVFPVTDQLGLPIVAYTALRWGELLRSTPDDPPGFVVPRAPAWYQFVLQNTSVAVTLMAPGDRTELEEDLQVLVRGAALDSCDSTRLAEHGDRVRRHAGNFP